MLYTRPDDYYVTQLSKEERRVYDIIVEGLLDLKERIPLKGVHFANPDASFEKISNALSVSRPDIFYETPSSSFQYDMFGNGSITYHFIYSKSQILRYREELSRICSNFAKSVAGYSKEYDVILAINRYLSEHVVYSAALDVEGGSAVGALIKGKARCEGIAQAFKLLADAVGITSFIAVGQAKADTGIENHAWNIVRYRGNYYHIDPTFNNGIKSASAPFDCPLFFLMSDEQVAETHFPMWNYPRCTDSTQEFYTKHGLSMKSPKNLKFLPSMEKDGKTYFIARLEWGPSLTELKNNLYSWLFSFCMKKGIEISGFCYDEKRHLLKAYT